uniref:Uncharacterized protein n=1 Tax=Pristionchus pacificus TaxID=54126 RepID=A0A2A6C656_PRIPA|eukprot:PDM73501.1 hypothetical protein PRIPAC_40857 [Pristionchus pacificus]
MGMWIQIRSRAISNVFTSLYGTAAAWSVNDTRRRRKPWKAGNAGKTGHESAKKMGCFAKMETHNRRSNDRNAAGEAANAAEKRCEDLREDCKWKDEPVQVT